MGHARVPCGQHREGWRFAAAGQGGSVFPAEAGSPVECAGAPTHQGDDAAEVGKKVRFGIGKLKGATRWMVVLLRRWVKPHGPLAGWLRNLVHPGLRRTDLRTMLAIATWGKGASWRAQGWEGENGDRSD